MSRIHCRSEIVLALLTSCCFAGCGDSASSPAPGGEETGGVPNQVASGSEWQAETVPPAVGISTLWGCYAASEAELYAVGEGGTILRSSGNGTWTKETNPGGNLFGVWGAETPFGPLRLAVGGDKILARDGATSTWSVTGENPGGANRSIWGSSGSDIYVGAGVGTPSARLLHSNDQGASWENVDIDGFPTALWGSGPDNLYALLDGSLYRTSGGAFTEVAGAAGSFSAVGGSGAHDVWLVGVDDQVAHSTDGITFASVPTGYTFDGPNGTEKPLWQAVWVGGGRVYVGGQPTIMSSGDNGATWQVEADLFGIATPANQITCIAGTPDGAVVFAVGGNGNVVLRKKR